MMMKIIIIVIIDTRIHTNYNKGNDDRYDSHNIIVMIIIQLR